MKFTRQRYQRGYLRRVSRANNKSAWEYRYADPQTGKEKSMYFSTEQFPTQTAVERHLETFVLKLNTDNPTLAVLEPTFDTLLDRFIEEERLLEIKKVRPGESCDNVGELSYSTASSYLSVIKRVRGKWGPTRITRLKPMNVQEWLRNLEAAPKTKGHIKAVIHRLYEKAMLWEMVEWQRNPMEFVEIKGISKRRKRPVILTFEQFFSILPLIPQPYRMMVLLAQCTGLRVEEVLAIEKPDFHFEKLSMQIVRAVVHGRVKLVKTEYSEDELPLDPDLAVILLDWIRQNEDEARQESEDNRIEVIESDLLFVSPVTGRHFHASPIGQDYIRPAGCCLVECPECGAQAGEWCKTNLPVPNGKRLPLHDERWDAAGKYGSVGWHTFRHTYRSWLDTRQIQSVESSDALRILERESRMTSVSLTGIQRQSNLEYRDAIETCRKSPDQGFAKLQDMGAVREVPYMERAQAVADVYRELTAEQNRKVLVVAPTHEEIGRVTQAIREDLKQRAVLGDGETLHRHIPLQWTEAQRKDISNYQPDQVLVFHRASHGIEKHEALTVTNASGSSIYTMNERGEEKSVSLTQARSFSVHERKEIEVAAGDKLLMMGNRKEPGFRATNGELTTIRSVERGIINLEDGRSVPANYREFTHGYAVTAHRSQGKTVDHVIVSADAMKQELFYVAASRGREGISIVTSDVDRLGESLGVSMARPSAIELANDLAQQKVSSNQDIAQGPKREIELPIKTPEIGFEMGLGF